MSIDQLPEWINLSDRHHDKKWPHHLSKIWALQTTLFFFFYSIWGLSFTSHFTHILYCLILFYIILYLFTILLFYFMSSSYVFHISLFMYRLPLSVCVNVQIGVSFCPNLFVVLCNCLFFKNFFFHLIKINSYFRPCLFPYTLYPCSSHLFFLLHYFTCAHLEKKMKTCLIWCNHIAL